MASKCGLCKKTVYAREKMVAANKQWHNWCFKCMAKVCEKMRPARA